MAKRTRHECVISCDCCDGVIYACPAGEEKERKHKVDICFGCLDKLAKLGPRFLQAIVKDDILLDYVDELKNLMDGSSVPQSVTALVRNIEADLPGKTAIAKIAVKRIWRNADAFEAVDEAAAKEG